MKTMKIFEPAMCCSTGLCGVSIDPELLRISTVLNNLEKKGIKVERFNLSNAPLEFITNQVVNQFINEKGADILPVTLLEGEIILFGRYPTNEEFVTFLNIPKEYLGDQGVEDVMEVETTCCEEDKEEAGGCCCSGGCC